MTELQSLLVVLAVIYAVDCLMWLPLGALAFSSIRWKRWRLRPPGSLAGNARGGFLLSNPLPPMGTIVYGQQLPLSLSPDGLGAWNPACPVDNRRPVQTARFVAWGEIQEVATFGKKLLVNGRTLLRASSESYAEYLADTIQELRKRPREKRAAGLARWFAGQLDEAAIRARLNELKTHSRRLQILGNVLFFSVFVGAPLVVWQFGLIQFLWQMLVIVFGQTVAIAIVFYRSHRTLVPTAREERWAWFLTMFLAVPTAMRAHDILARRTLERFHPLALARVLCRPDAFRSLAKQLVLDLRHPMEPVCPATGALAQATVSFSQEYWRTAVDTFLAQAGLPAAELLALPKPAEPALVAYCPRCLTQYMRADSRCAECGGKALVRFEIP